LDFDEIKDDIIAITVVDTHLYRGLDLADRNGLLRAPDLEGIDAPHGSLSLLTAAAGGSGSVGANL